MPSAPLSSPDFPCSPTSPSLPLCTRRSVLRAGLGMTALALGGLGRLSLLGQVAAVQPTGQETGSTRVLKWKGGKEAVYLLAFDDACPTHLTNVIPELTRREMVGNFYINPGKGTYPGKKAEWQKLTANPQVVFCNHTYTHAGAEDARQLDEELEKCNVELRALYPDRPWPRLIAFGKPGGVPWKVSDEELAVALAKHHLIDRPPFYGPPIHFKSAAELVVTVDAALKKGDMAHADFHGVGGDWLPTPMEWFTALLDRLEQEKDRVWVASNVAYHQYAKERDAATVKVNQIQDARLQLKLTTTLNADLYNHPLTLETHVPADWKMVQINQGNTVSKATVNNGVARYEAIPGPADITLSAITP